MGLLAQINRQIKAGTYNDTEGWFANWLRGDTDGDSGVSVNEKTAMRISMVWKCVNWRARMFGMLPKKIYERTKILGRDARQEARNHPLYDVIHTAPNPSMTSAAWFSLISADLHLWGNSYAYIERGNKTGRILRLWRILPDTVRIDVDYQTNVLTYVVRYGDGREERFRADEILHIRGLGFDGVCGYSPIRMQADALGWTKATRKFSAKFYRNAFRPSGLLVSPTTIKEPAKSDLVKNLKEQGKEGGLALIEGALEYKPLGIPQNDAQFIETMQYQDEDICGIMEVKPHKVGIMRNMTNNNVEQQNIESTTDCIQPLAVSVEQWLDLQLLSDLPSTGIGGASERDRYFIECELKVLLRGDTAAQTQHIEKMIDRGVYSDNDARDYLGLPPYQGGDRYWINSAYQPIDRTDELIDKKVEPTPVPAPPASPTPEQKPPANLKKVLGGLLRDAIGRTAHRPAKDRERAAATILRPCLAAAFELAELDLADFLDGYLEAMALRASLWKESAIDSIAAEETDRLLTTIKEKKESSK